MFGDRVATHEPGRDYASRTQRTSVPKFGGLPNIKRPMRNTFDANHTAPTTPRTPIAIDSHTCHVGGGCDEASRSNMPNELTGGRKLTTTESVESGSREIGFSRWCWIAGRFLDLSWNRFVHGLILVP